MTLTDPYLGLIYGYAVGSGGWNTGFDANMQKLGAVINVGVVSKSQDAGAIGVPAANARYIVPVGGTGVFAGQDNNLALYVAGAWEFIIPEASGGWVVYVEDTASWWGFNGSVWVEMAAPVSGSGFADAPNDGNYYVRHANGWTNQQSANPGITTQDTAYTLQTTDANSTIRMNCTSNQVLTIDTNAVVPFETNTTIIIDTQGAGLITVTGASGVVVNCAATAPQSRAQHSQIVLQKVDVDEWNLSGDLTV
jgi:hypothetical protein